MKKSKLQSLLKTTMSRKEFLMFGVSAILAFTGITHLETTLHSLIARKNSKVISNSTGGFSNGPYGGKQS